MSKNYSKKILIALFSFLSLLFLILTFTKINFSKEEGVSFIEFNEAPENEAIILENEDFLQEEEKIETDLGAQTSTQEDSVLGSSDLRLSQNHQKFYFKVNDDLVESEYLEGQTVLDVMYQLQSQNKISFSGKNFSGLGFFINEINGEQENRSQGLYWKYYINNQEANLGISSYVIKPGDLIEWRKE